VAFTPLFLKSVGYLVVHTAHKVVATQSLGSEMLARLTANKQLTLTNF
jgi:hypothetical protein